MWVTYCVLGSGLILWTQQTMRILRHSGRVTDPDGGGIGCPTDAWGPTVALRYAPVPFLHRPACAIPSHTPVQVQAVREHVHQDHKPRHEVPRVVAQHFADFRYVDGAPRLRPLQPGHQQRGQGHAGAVLPGAVRRCTRRHRFACGTRDGARPRALWGRVWRKVNNSLSGRKEIHPPPPPALCRPAPFFWFAPALCSMPAPGHAVEGDAVGCCRTAGRTAQAFRAP